jgi:SAM-dependent methyltransferase
MNLPKSLREKLRCPVTHCALITDSDHLRAIGAETSYPIVGNIPILIDDSRSLFSIADFENNVNTTFQRNESKIDTVKRFLPGISLNLKCRENFDSLNEMLEPGSDVLILGGSIRGEGMEAFYERNDLNVVSSDVSFGPETSLICDGHDIPFESGSFDCVIVQAVLEHVVDPQRCVSEIWRVLKKDGIVYAETPFMQQVHMKQYDFTRFTHLGHRRLFRYFSEVSSGPGCGPGMALAWAYRHFLTSFSSGRKSFLVISLFANLTAFWLKYLDYILIDKPGGYDGASGYFFLGRKADEPISDRELIKHYRGRG